MRKWMLQSELVWMHANHIHPSIRNAWATSTVREPFFGSAWHAELNLICDVLQPFHWELGPRGFVFLGCGNPVVLGKL